MKTGRGWKPKDYCPLQLRTVAAVLADAKPAVVDGGYRWWQAGGDWWGVDPTNGVLPTEIVVRMDNYREVHSSSTEAMRALHKACDGLKFDGFGNTVEGE